MQEKNNGQIAPSDIFGSTHAGLVRNCNEDGFVYYADPSNQNAFVAVADGIGGHASGDVASRLCLRSLIISWRKSRLWNEKSVEKIKNFLENEVEQTNNEIFKINKSFNIQHPMGTTLVAGIFMPDSVVIAHAGDSRCYRQKKKSFELLTHDHSFVEELIIRNIITRKEAKDHPFAHIISKCVGTTSEMVPEMNVYQRSDSERYIFCSDGLINHLEDSQISEIVADSKNPQDVVRNLLYASLKRGGEDNITVLSVFT